MCLKILLVLFLISIVKCNSMSKSELEDFSNFLKRTSVLDQTLKKTPGVGASDEDELISDINAWEESGKFEGDLVLNDRQRKVIVENVAEGLSRNGLNDITKRWPDNMVVFYIQREHFNGGQVRAILEGIEDLARASCVKFRPYRKGDRDAVVVQGSRRGCFSQVGYQGGYQVLNLSGRHPVGRGCFRHGTIVHEFLHTLGFYHMQSSPDRDDYIKVHWENIIEQAKHNFRKYNSFSVSDFGVGYDYDSVLHYSRKAFSSNGQDTLVPKQGGADIGQRLGLSDKDTQKLNKMYCDADNNNNNDEHGPIIQRKPKKTKKSKNQPFDGHGIGYHQGKTLVIKVPTTTTIQVTSMPIYRSFDYSSKLPTTPVVQRVGTGQEIVYWSYPYSLYTNRRDNQHPKDRTDPQKFSDKASHSKIFVETPSTAGPPISAIVTEKTNGNSKNKTTIEDLGQISKTDENKNITDVKHDELTAAIKRLEDLVKTRLVLIEDKPDYTKYYPPEIKFETDPEIKNVDKSFRDSSLPKRIEKYDPDTPGIKKAREFIKSLSDFDIQNDTLQEKYKEKNEKKGQYEVFTPETNSSNIIQHPLKHQYESFTPEMDSSYRTAYPFKKLDYHKENHELAELKYDPIHKLSDKFNYSDLYFPTHDTKPGSAIKTHQKVFGDDTNPLGDPKWYRKVELDNTPLRYDKDRYTYYGPDSSQNKSEKLRSRDSSDENTRPTALDGYSLFGQSVPTNAKWFKEHEAYEPPIKDIQHTFHENTTSNKSDIKHNTSENLQRDENSESEEVGDEIDKSTSDHSLFGKPVVTNEKWFKPHLNQQKDDDNNSRSESDTAKIKNNSETEDISHEDKDDKSNEKLYSYLNYEPKEFNDDSNEEDKRLSMSEKLQNDIYSGFLEATEDIEGPVTTAYERLYKEFENYEPPNIDNHSSTDENNQNSEETR